MFSTETLMVLVPALPLAASLITAALGRHVLRGQSHWPTVTALVLSFVLSMLLLFDVRAASEQAAPPAASGAGAQRQAVGVEVLHTLWTWAAVEDASATRGEAASAGRVDQAPSVAGDFRVDVTLRADPLTAIMLAMVTFVSSLVAIYSAGYMRGDPGYWRFFSCVSLFVFSMTMLVSVSNFVLLYVFWEAVGVCSYLLIGFWYEKPEAAAAGKKAFLVNRVGDFGFALGVFLLWTTYGTLNFHDVDRVGRPVTGGAEVASGNEVAVEGVLGQSRLAASGVHYVGGAVGLAICLCLLAGACGKSAQFPLHVWLPDAMEGPTPVSALIHAATMVTAGVYLVARCAPLFAVSPEARLAVAAVGCFTGLMAGIVAMTQNDLKRVLAWSTISQLGYMFLGLGTGTLAGITAGMFHLFTHAFFKALLFLSAGSVMHAMGGVLDIRRLGGLRRVLPWTHLTFWFGCLALAGVVPFAGFWSKDAILAAVHERSTAAASDYAPFYQVLYFTALFTALLTAVYTFRALFLTFFGPLRIPPEAGHHAHESPTVMLVPLLVLAACSALVGAWFEWTHGFADFLAQTPSLAYREIEHAAHGSHVQVALVSTLIAVTGVALAAFLYLGDRRRVESLARLASSPYALRLYQLSSGRFFFDQIYQVLIVWPLRLTAAVAYWIDRWLVDGLVNASGRLPWEMGSVFRALQNGLVQFYALAMMLGLLVLIGTLLLWPGL